MSDALKRACASWRSFAERFIRIRCKDGRERGFQANGAQLYIARRKSEIVHSGRRPWFLLPKARRMGVTTRESIVSFYRCRCFSGTHAAAVAFRDEDVTSIFDDQARRFLRALPAWFQPQMRRSNSRELLFEKQGSRFFVTSGRAAGGGGGVRGGTVQRVHVTEAAYAPAQLDMDDVMAGYTLAASHGDVTMESTGNGPSGWFYDETMRALTGKSEWSVIFAPWFLLEEYADLVPEGLVIVPGEAHHEDFREYAEDEAEFIARTRAEWGMEIMPEQLLFRRRMRREYAKGRKFLDQFPEQIHDCFQAASGCFFDTGQILRLRSECLDPIEQDWGDEWSWKVWAKPSPGLRYIAGMDIAEGVEGGDWTYLTIHRRDTMEQVAAWHGHMRPKDAARLAVVKAADYNRAELIPERNNHGITVVDEIEASGYGSLYYHDDGKPGWRTDGQTRPAMLDALSDALESWSCPIRIHDQAFHDECIGFRRNASGKYEGNPDDRVMGVAMAVEGRARAQAPRIYTLREASDAA